MDGYFDYYSRVLNTKQNGLKLVLGGTGLGKTRGICTLIGNTTPLQDSRKFVYVANRIQLLNEMYDDLTNTNHPDDPSYPGLTSDAVIHLERNRDTVVNALSADHQDTFFDILYAPIVSDIAAKQKLDVVSVEKSARQVIQIQKLRSSDQVDPSIDTLIERNVEAYTSEILSFFRQVTLKATEDEKRHLLHHPIIQVLFPYIAFEQNQNARVLLVTIQKGFLGFFDGSTNVSLMRLKNCIVFLDEFDFLESDLIDLISQSAQIEDPFLLVDMFYRAMTRHKLPLETYPFPPNASQKVERIRRNIDDIVSEISKLDTERNLPFPDINQFTTQLREKKTAIFQTNRMIIPQPLYLKETSRSFEIVHEKSDKNVDALHLFNAVQWAMNRVLILFNSEIASISNRMYEEMLSQCFPQSYLSDQIKRISQFPRSYQNQDTRFGNLLNVGYGLYEIQDLQQITDEDEVKFRLYSIHTTPEKVILAISSQNTVFGLSATADIPRHVKHFNIPWLRQQLFASEDATYFDVNDTDEETIQHLNSEKLTARNNNINLRITQSLQDYDIGKKISKHIKRIASHFPDGFGKDDNKGFRRRRVEHFFSTLLSIVEDFSSEPHNAETHLLFYNSFKQIKFVLSNSACHEGLSWLSVDSLQLDNKHFAAYRIHFEGLAFNIIFYDAGQAKSIQNSEDVKAAYHQLFWDGVPVVVVTQYASAGNGVNLQYKPYPDAEEIDFINIHLLDSPFFFFDQVNPRNHTIPQIDSAIKKNLWYQAKLYEGKIISTGKFFSLLENLRGYGFNSEYNRSRNDALNIDALCNRMSIYIQALGRIERVWHELPDQSVFMTYDVFNDFSSFYLDESYYLIREQRKSRVSNNLRQLIQQVEVKARQMKRQAKRDASADVASREAKCKGEVAHLLLRIENLRRTGEDRDARVVWGSLRDAALKHDFANSLLSDYHATFHSSFYRNDVLYMDDDLRVFPHNSRTPSARPIRLNSIYDVIRENQTIASHFMRKGYELAFDSSSDKFFVPYFYQAILVGAIGEAAIERLLTAYAIPVDDGLPDNLFELADLKIANKPWYVDCKNYSERTLDQFVLDEEDPAYHPSLTEATFTAKARSKIHQIKKHHSDREQDCKLIYINLVSSDNRLLRYINSRNFDEDTSFDDADIIIIQGAIHREDPNRLSTSFQHFVDEYQYRI